ncbi:MAG: hypothetical protein H7A01_15060 [Hahellaceae bacterium]|nr:hypothetical protein [Hahellaceae bacterium]MCP5210377.1 hypothetical protein [Hahellaceae bacterium]
MKTLLSLMILLFSAAVSGEIGVVVSNKSEINNLSSQEVANIFLGRTNRYPNGAKSIPVELRGNNLRSSFYQSISGKTPTQLSAYWTTLVFTGKGRPPEGYRDLKDLILSMEQKPESITYLDEEQVTDAMKIVYSFR